MHSSINHSFHFHQKTVNIFRERGASSLSDALMKNTTLTQLNINGKYKKKQNTNSIHHQPTLFHLFKQTGNNIGEAGRISLSGALKTNTTLTKFIL